MSKKPAPADERPEAARLCRLRNRHEECPEPEPRRDRHRQQARTQTFPGPLTRNSHYGDQRDQDSDDREGAQLTAGAKIDENRQGRGGCRGNRRYDRHGSFGKRAIQQPEADRPADTGDDTPQDIGARDHLGRKHQQPGNESG
jgi:hypothetical protein